MRLFKEKLAWIAPIAVVLIIALFSVNLFAQSDPKPVNMPVALVINDEGEHVENVLSTVELISQGIDGEQPAFAFTIEREEDLSGLFRDKKYYAALVIPAGYDEGVEHAIALRSPAQLHVYVNQGFNMTGANLAQTALLNLVDRISAQYAIELAEQYKDQPIMASDAAVLVQPVIAETTLFYPVASATANGNAPVLMAMPAWVGALIGGFLLFLATSIIAKVETLTPRQSLGIIGGQLALGVVIALFSGFTVATLAAGVNMPDYFLVAAFISYAAYCFFLLVSAVTAWIGKPAITLFMIVMLLGMGVIMMPKEMLPDFFVNFVRPWIPIRFASDGLRDIFYFGSGFYTGRSFNIITAIGGVSLVIYLLSALKARRGKKTAAS